MASLLKNVASQNITFCMINASTGAADASATVAVKVTKDNGSQASGGGTVTNSGNGQYNYAPTQAETNATDVGFMFTATGDIPVNADFHTDPGVMLTAGTGSNQINIDGSGNVPIVSNVKKNTASSGFMFVMTNASTGAPMTGLTVTSQVAIDGGAFASTTNAVSEISNGWYKLNLAAADVNGNHIALRFSSAGANDTDIEIVTQP